MSDNLILPSWLSRGIEEYFPIKGADKNFSEIIDHAKKNKMGFFESDIVQEEAKKLFTDYQELMKLGSDYGKFDREGKKMFIKKMESLMDRYKVFMKRFELSEDFQAKNDSRTIKDTVKSIWDYS